MPSPLHESIVAQVVQNNGLHTKGFWNAMGYEFFLGENLFDLTEGESEELKTPYDVKRALQWMTSRRQPDAFRIHRDHPFIEVWEVSVAQKPEVTLEGWMDLVEGVLDRTGIYGIAIVDVVPDPHRSILDRAGICRCSFLETFSGPGSARDVSTVVWRSDEPCPFRFADVIDYRDDWLSDWRESYAERLQAMQNEARWRKELLANRFIANVLYRPPAIGSVEWFFVPPVHHQGVQ